MWKSSNDKRRYLGKETYFCTVFETLKEEGRKRVSLKETSHKWLERLMRGEGRTGIQGHRSRLASNNEMPHPK